MPRPISLAFGDVFKYLFLSFLVILIPRCAAGQTTPYLTGGCGGGGTISNNVLTLNCTNNLPGPTVLFMPVSLFDLVSGSFNLTVVSVADSIEGQWTQLIAPTSYCPAPGNTNPPSPCNQHDLQLWVGFLPHGVQAPWTVTVTYNRNPQPYDNTTPVLACVYCSGVGQLAFSVVTNQPTPSGPSITTPDQAVVIAISSVTDYAVQGYAIPSGTFTLFNDGELNIDPYGTNSSTVLSPAGTYAPQWNAGSGSNYYQTPIVVLSFSLPPPPPDPGPCDECESMAGQPINLSTGDVWVQKTDYSVSGLAGGLSLTRTWNSLWNLNNPPFSAGMFGTGWTSDYEERLQVLGAGTIEYWRASGNTWVFVQPNGCPSCSYSVSAPTNRHASLAYNSSTSLYTLTLADGTKKTFNSSGYLTAIADRNSNQTTVTYDTSNRITKVTAPGTQSLTFSYGLVSDPNRVTSSQDSVGNVATYTYSNSLLLQTAYPDGGQLTYTYDANNNITAVTDSQGKTIETHTYDTSGRGLTSARANGADAVSIQYAAGSTTLTDSMSNNTAYAYAAIAGRNFITGIQGPGCDSCGGRNNQAFALDSSGNRLTITDPNGNTTNSTYDLNSNVLTRSIVVNGTTLTWAYTYNSFQEVLTAADPLGFVTTNTYDANGNLLTTTTPSPDGGTTAGSKTQFTYDSKGELTKITDPLSNATTLTYFSTGLLNTIKDAQRNVTTFGYDGRGNRTSVKDALNSTTFFAYDTMNRLKKITNPDTTTTQFAYDTRGRRTSVTDANNKLTQYGYDDADRLVSVTDAANNVTAYAYDTENHLVSITDANNHATSFNYDPLGRVTKTTFPSSAVETYGYDGVGNLTGKTDRKNQTINYSYDALNRLTQKSYPDSTAVAYTYDNDSRLTQVSDPTGTYQFTYDNMGRLSTTSTHYSILTSRSFTTSYSYDKASNRSGFTDPEAGLTIYAYDTLNRLQTLTPPAAIGGGSFGFAYDALNRRMSMSRPNSVTTSYSYDTLSRLLSVLHKKKTTTLDGVSYTVDNVGNRLTRTPQPSGAASTYGYDALYELTSVQQGSTTTESYSYDPAGNRLSSLGVASYSYNPSNELTSTSNATYGYDNNGNTASKTDSTGTTNYTWDFENRLTSVTLPGGSGTVSFKYDPFGRRIYKSSSSGASIYAYDKDNLVEETNSSGVVVARYAQGLLVDEPLATLRSGTTSYYNADGLGSVTSVSNVAGALVQTYGYDAFGKQTSSSGSLINPFQFTSREFDTESSLYYMRARYFDPSNGRFLSEDPTGFRAGINFYRYVRNSVVNRIDPTGMYELQNFTPQGAAQMTIAIGKLVAKLNNSCCIDPDVRRRILNHLQPFSYGSGATINYHHDDLILNGKQANGTAGPFPSESITLTESAMNGSDTCSLEGILLHELVHLTWHNVWLGVKDPNLAEDDAYAKSAACYGSGCQKPPEP